MSRPPHHPNNIRWRIQAMKFILEVKVKLSLCFF
jgi:hypothetical protein